MSNAKESGVPIPVAWLDVMPRELQDKPCFIENLSMDVHVCGLYAQVDETILIANPNGRAISASLSLALPDRGRVCGYALDIDGEMREGVVVPKEQARIAFETEQRFGADPGLVEVVKGNVHQVRVYPVPANSHRVVRLSYTCPLTVKAGDEAFLNVPLPADHIGCLTIDVDVRMLASSVPAMSGFNVDFVEEGVFWRASVTEDNFCPKENLTIALPKLPESFSIIEEDERGQLWFSASSRVPETLVSQNKHSDMGMLTVLWDASGSRSQTDHARELQLLQGYAADDHVGQWRLVPFADAVGDPILFDAVSDMIDAIKALRYDGGTDLSRMMEFVDAEEDVDKTYLLFTDGLDTLSEQQFSFPSDAHVLAVVSGSQIDAESLRQACHGCVYDVNAAPIGYESLWAAMFASRLLSGITGDGVSQVLGIGTGRDGRFSIIGKMNDDHASISLNGIERICELDGKSAVAGKSLSRAWASMRVSQLSPCAEENSDELLELGREFGIASPVTSLLVLETIEQWLRYDVEPPESWTQMHEAWHRLRPGRMQLSSEEERERRHLESVKRQWAELLKWWEEPPRADKPAIQEGVAGIASRLGDAMASVMPARARSVSSDMDYYASGMAGARVYSAGGISADEMSPMDCAEEACVDAVSFEAASPMEAKKQDSRTAASVKVKAWMPNADYLAKMDEALKDGWDAVSDVYYVEREEYESSPSFFIDCSGWYLAHGRKEEAIRILTNLAEMRIEDASLLRVMAWRLREADELEHSLAVLRRVLKLRPEDSQSHRDMALVLSELAYQAHADEHEADARKYALEAGDFYRKVVFTPWARRPLAAALFAVEEYNVFRAWIERSIWEEIEPPVLESLGESLEGVLECDLRITLAWDADETDVDLHVTEPSGEEAYYGHRLTSSGGRVSEDITDGYGPELYEIRKASDGVYDIRAHYFASHQQTVFGPASCTLTVYTNWGRLGQGQTITSVRLENEKEMVDVGKASYGSLMLEDEPSRENATWQVIRLGMGVEELVEAYGMPDSGDIGVFDGEMSWVLTGGRIRVARIEAGRVIGIVERMSWGEEMVIV